MGSPKVRYLPRDPRLPGDPVYILISAWMSMSRPECPDKTLVRNFNG